MKNAFKWLVICIVGVFGSLNTAAATLAFNFTSQQTVVDAQDKRIPSFVDQIELTESEESSDQHAEPFTWPAIPFNQSQFGFASIFLKRLPLHTQKGWRTAKVAPYLRFENLRI